MATEVQVGVKVNSGDALAILSSIDAEIKKLNSTAATVAVKVTGTDAAKKSFDKLALAEEKTKQAAESTAQAKLATAAQIAAANAMVAQSEQQTAQMQIAANAQVASAALATAAAKETAEIQADAAIQTAMQQTAAVQFATFGQIRTAAEETAQAEIAANARVEAATLQSEARIQAAREKTTQEQIKADSRVRVQELKNEGAAAREAAGGYNALSVAIGSIASRAFHMVVRKITQSIREAVEEMKNVDTQLTNISKVSGKTGKELAAIGDQAYDTASKYGVAASEYLSAVYTFQKAGLGDSAEQMGELAVKTMLVGDTTADVASQFLISANAAWKLGGNMERLGQIVDEADYINNNYATSLDKLSSGLPRVASVAAQAGMSAEETLAAIGTITAVTQESGTKAATALRALILNIEGQVGTFVDDTGEEFEVTAESVKSMQGLMEKYAKAELDAARASGELINPMTAIQAIFEGMANSDLNDQELFALLSTMGGKLRTNQLTALVENYQLFSEMLDKVADSAGTADAEIDLMMGSWERKTQRLKNSWTELISDVLSTEFVKGGIDGLTNLINKVDELFDRTKDPWYDSNKTKQEISSTEAQIDSLKKAIEGLSGTDDANSQARVHNLEVELEYQEKILAMRKAQYDLEHQEEANKLQRELTAGNLDTITLSQFGEMVGDQAFTGNIADYQQSLKSVLADYQSYYEKVLQVRDAGKELTADQQQFVRNYEQINDLASNQEVNVGQVVDGYLQLVDASGNVIAAVRDIGPALDAGIEPTEAMYDGFGGIADYFVALDTGMIPVSERMEALAGEAESINFDSAVASAERLAAALEDAAGAAQGIWWGGFGFATGTTSAPGGPTLVNELGPELISENGRAYIANGGRPGIVNLQRGAIVLPASVTKEALRGGGKGSSIHAAAGETAYGTMGSSNTAGLLVYDTPKSRDSATDAEELRKELRDLRQASQEVAQTWTGSGSGGKKSVKKQAEELSDTLASLDKQAKLANNELDFAREAELYEMAQEAIKEMVDAYREAGYAEDSDEIVDLLNKNYDYANKQLSLYQSKWDELISSLKSDTDAQELANKLAEKQLAVDEAREALANAQRQRTIRMYNAATGQWEWIADQSKIKSAQESLTKAEEDYADEVKSQAIKELENLRDTVTDLNDVVLGPALSAVAMMGEDTDEFQAFARALNAVYGVGTFLSSTAGTERAISTMDSHDVHYSFGGISLTGEQAATMTLAQLAEALRALNLTV